MSVNIIHSTWGSCMFDCSFGDIIDTNVFCTLTLAQRTGNVGKSTGKLEDADGQSVMLLYWSILVKFTDDWFVTSLFCVCFQGSVAVSDPETPPPAVRRPHLGPGGQGERPVSLGVVQDAGDAGLTLLERLIWTHPIWYLPSISRQQATHLLQNRDEGVSILHYAIKCHTFVPFSHLC